MITGAVSAAFISSLNQSTSTNHHVQESNDAQLIASFFVRDAESAAGTNPLTGKTDLTLGVSVPSVSGCAAPAGVTTTPLVGFGWNDYSSAGHTPDIVNYAYVTAAPTGTYAAQQLIRTLCIGAATPQTAVLAHHVLSAPTITCYVGGAAQASCAPFPDQVVMQVTETSTIPGGPSTYSFEVTGTLRSNQGTGPDTSEPAPLILLGRSGCGGSEGTTGDST